VNDLGRQVLAGAALAGEQHRRCRTGGDLVQKRLELGHHRRVADDPVEPPLLRLTHPQGPDLAAQPRGLQGFLHDEHQLVEVERLVRVVVGALLHDLHGGFDVRVRRQEDDEGVGIMLLDLLQQAQTVGIGQLEVEQDEIDGVSQGLVRRAAAVGLEHAVALLLEPLAQRPADQRLIVHDQDRRRQHQE